MLQFFQQTILQLVMCKCSASAVEKLFQVHQNPPLIFSLAKRGPIGDGQCGENNLAEHTWQQLMGRQLVMTHGESKWALFGGALWL